LVERGMKPVDALKARTSVNARLLGIAGETGTLEAGKLADIVAVSGDLRLKLARSKTSFL
jgi:imidazolonepropionase-like amidohydrolase